MDNGEGDGGTLVRDTDRKPLVFRLFRPRFEGSLPSEPNSFPLSIDEVSLSWELGDWEVDATATLGVAIYWLKVEAETAFDLDTCGEVSLELALLWTETDLRRVQSVLSYEPGSRLAIAIDWDIDLDVGQLDKLAVNLQIEW